MSALLGQLTGLTREHLGQVFDGLWLHREAIEPFLRLREAAAGAGIDLAVASGYRDFQRQLTIWNRKATGEQPVLSPDGSRELDVSALSAEELLFAILRWSALPGTSRHHWGSDMDIWDAGAVGADYQLQLTPSEYAETGPFARLGAWLAGGNPDQYGFCRPYPMDSGGVSPEPWHISYRPVADRYGRAFDPAALAQRLADTDIELKAAILDNFDEIIRRFVVLEVGADAAANGLK